MRHTDGQSRSGQLSLTADGLRFQATGHSGEEGSFLIGLSAIRTASFRAWLKLLTIQAGEETWRFSGPGAAEVHAQLPDLLGGRAPKPRPVPKPPPAPPKPPPPGDPQAWPAALRHGIVAHPGELRVLPEGLRFHLTGRLDALVGVRPFTLPFREIARATLKGWPERKLELLHEGGELRSFSVRDLPTRWAALPELLAADLARLLTEPLALSYWLDRSVRLWPQLFALKERADALLFTPALQRVHHQALRLGVLILTRSRVLFLPTAGSAEPAFTCGLGRVERSLDEDPLWIRFQADRSLIELRPAGGEAEVTRFWTHCRAPSRILSYESAGRRTLERTTSASAFIRLRVDGAELATLSPGQALRHIEGWGVIVPAALTEPLLAAERVGVEIGQDEGVYQFDSRAVRAAPVPPTFRTTLSDEAWLVICAWPEELRVYNQREEVRVPVDLPGTLRLPGDAEALILPTPIRLRNLSRGGFCAVLQRALRQGDRLHCVLRGPDDTVEIGAEVRRVDRGPDGAYTIGVRLLHQDRGSADLIGRMVMSAQRRDLAGPHGPDDDPSVL